MRCPCRTVPITPSSETGEHNVTLTLGPTSLLGHPYGPPGSAESILAATWIQPLTLVTDQISSGPERPPGPTEPPGADCPSSIGQAGRPRLQLSHAEPAPSPLRSCSETMRDQKARPRWQPPFSSLAPPTTTLLQPQVPTPAHLRSPALDFLRPAVPGVLPYLPPGVLSLPTLGGRSYDRTAGTARPISDISILSGRNRTAFPSTSYHVPGTVLGTQRNYKRDLCPPGAHRSAGRQTELV